MGQAPIGIGGELACVVASLTTFEVTRVIVVAIFASKILVARTGLNQRAVPAEVLTREQFVLVGNGQQFVEEFDDRVVNNQALTVLGEDRWHPAGVRHGQADEPGKEKVMRRLLHQQALGVDAVEDLQQHGRQQLFRSKAARPSLMSAAYAPERSHSMFFNAEFTLLRTGCGRVVVRHEVIRATRRE